MGIIGSLGLELEKEKVVHIHTHSLEKVRLGWVKCQELNQTTLSTLSLIDWESWEKLRFSAACFHVTDILQLIILKTLFQKRLGAV